MKVSVIIPVYNAGESLLRCYESLIHQTLDDVELIFVDDASKDGCIHQLDSRVCPSGKTVKILCQDHNEGVSAARNRGLEEMSGKYVTFVDADDYLEPEALEKLFFFADEHNLDWVICNYYKNYPDHQEFFNEDPKTDNPDIVSALLLTHLNGGVMNKFYKSELIQDYRIRFPEGIIHREDLIFSLRFLALRPRVGYLDQAFYHYTFAGTNLSSRYNDIPVSEHIKALDAIHPLMDSPEKMVQFRNLVALVAYDATTASHKACPSYCELFQRFKEDIKLSNLHPVKKLFCMMKMHSIPVPVKLFRHISFLRAKKNASRNSL